MLTASLIMWLAAGTHPTNAFDLPLAPVRFAWSSPLAQRNDLYAVKGTPDGSHIWAVGAAGTVLSLRGEKAVLEATGTDQDLYDVWVVAKDDVWAVGERGTILHRDAKSWSRAPSGTKQALHSIWGRDAHDLWIGGGGGVVLHREGDQWRTVPSPTIGPIASIAGCDGGAVCAVTLANSLPSIDTSNRPCHDPDGDCPMDEPQEPEGDRVLRWSEGRWSSTIYLGDGTGPYRMAAVGTTLWLTDDTLLRTAHAGKRDEMPVMLPKDADLIRVNGLWARDEKDGWLVGERCTAAPGGTYLCDHGAIWRFNGRKTAILRKEAPATPLWAVWAWSAKAAIAVGERGTIIRFDGTSWTPVSKPVTDVDLRGVLSVPTSPNPTSRGTVTLRASENENEPRPRTVELVIAEGGTTPWGLLKQAGPAPERTHDDTDTWLIADCEALRARGQSWITYFPRECVPYAATRKIVGSGGNDAWMAPGVSGPSQSPLPSEWNPTKTNVRAPASGLVDLWASKKDDVWFVGRRYIAHWDGRALTETPPGPWLEAFADLTSVWGSDATNVWVAAYSGVSVKLARWNGTIWQAAASFDFHRPRRLQSIDPAMSEPLFPTTFRDSPQVALWGTSASDVWLAGPNGIVLRFDGRRWQRVATPTRHQLFGLGGTRDHVVAVGATGTILELDQR